MNITTSVIERNRNLKEQVNKESLSKEAVGIEYYRRIISIYPSISKNIHNIDGNNVLLNSKCMIINYSVSHNQNVPNATLYNKTTYICDLMFPGNITPQMLTGDITKILSNAVIEPIYAFNNPHYEKPDNKFVDLGLTMVDLNSDDQYGVVNFSQINNDERRNYMQDIVTAEYFNPKIYIPQEKELKNDNIFNKSGVINDFVDNHTLIIKDLNNYKRNIAYKNGVERTDRVINKRSMKSNELLLDIFSDLIFMPIEDLEMIISASSSGVTHNIKRFTTFKRFNREINKYYYDKVAESVLKTIKQFRNIMNGENFYITIQKNETLFSLNIAFENRDNSVDEIRITNPIYKLYSQFALNNESMVNSIESDGDYAKACLIESYCNNSDNLMRGLINNINDISGKINTIANLSRQIDNYKTQVLLNHYNNSQKLIE